MYTKQVNIFSEKDCIPTMNFVTPTTKVWDYNGDALSTMKKWEDAIHECRKEISILERDYLNGKSKKEIEEYSRCDFELFSEAYDEFFLSDYYLSENYYDGEFLKQIDEYIKKQK